MIGTMFHDVIAFLEFIHLNYKNPTINMHDHVYTLYPFYFSIIEQYHILMSDERTSKKKKRGSFIFIDIISRKIVYDQWLFLVDFFYVGNK